jgi:hypothetical protein
MNKLLSYCLIIALICLAVGIPICVRNTIITEQKADYNNKLQEFLKITIERPNMILTYQNDTTKTTYETVSAYNIVTENDMKLKWDLYPETGKVETNYGYMKVIKDFGDFYELTIFNFKKSNSSSFDLHIYTKETLYSFEYCFWITTFDDNYVLDYPYFAYTKDSIFKIWCSQ